ncbi:MULTISPECIES: hypothetical protein [unclassified Amycolatopsis]|uniref:hypothetical protein n=1 Tax=unclassified Amycolatopsis TaxID=2618356 RepID=UPI002E14149A|nr:MULTISPECIES: hypothetical protein [unclassified Amycolatopsis]WSK82896.1 hypothetical protein OG570_20970 [Amycolatopsis sp. NBC_01286]
MGDEAPPRWWGEEGARPRPDPAGWWPEADTLHWVAATNPAPADPATVAGP